MANANAAMDKHLISICTIASLARVALQQYQHTEQILRACVTRITISASLTRRGLSNARLAGRGWCGLHRINAVSAFTRDTPISPIVPCQVNTRTRALAIAPADATESVMPFRKGLEEGGYVEGRNVAKSAAGHRDR
jgi:hypothetical protein